MSKFRILHRIRRDTLGGTAIEYGLIVAMLVVASLVAYQGLADANIGTWMNTTNKVMSATNGDVEEESS